MVYRMDRVGRKKRKTRDAKMTLREGGTKLVQLPPVPVIAAGNLLDRFGFKEMIDNAVEWDRTQWNVSPGDLAKAMVMSMFWNYERPALVNIGRTFCGLPMNMMFDEIRSSDEIGRYVLAETLDRIHDAGSSEIFRNVSSAVRAHWGIVTKIVHSDLTTVPVEGVYAAEDPEFNITYGYSKDMRNDLKQYTVGYAVGDHGLLMNAEAMDGNASDIRWNEKCLDSMHTLLAGGHAVYVADCKLMTMALIRNMHSSGILFVSRCPYNFAETLEHRVLDAVNIEEMEDIGASSASKNAAVRKIKEFQVTAEDIPLRAIAVKSSSMDGKGDAAVEKEKKAVDEMIGKFAKVYKCRPDAEKAFAKLSKKIGKTVFDAHATFSKRIVETRKKGRPRKDGTDIMRAEECVVDISVTANPDRERMLRRSAEMYVIISNVPSENDDPVNGMSAKDLVDLYGRQWKVEGQFKSLKTPAIADQLFIKTQPRAEALIMLMNVAILLRGLMQLLIRKGLEAIPDEELPHYGHDDGILQRNVTADFFIRTNQSCLMVTEPDSNEYWFADPDGKSAMRAKFFFGLLGIQAENIFG